MAPNQPMSYFQRPARSHSGGYLSRLTKLYSDAKQSYESAKVVSDATANLNNDPEVDDLRRDFQIQQDRLLAWGMHWADVEAQFNAPEQQRDDVDIDKKIDQAGLGEVVASVMSQIKSLLDESGRLQHPEKYELASKGLRSPGISEKAGLRRKEWSQHEVQTGRTLLEQLTMCIDVLYSLIESRQAEGKDGKKKAMEHRYGHEEDSYEVSKGDKKGSSAYGGVAEHPLHIAFRQLDFHHVSNYSSTDPPPYDESEATVSTAERSFATYRGENKVVLVDFLSLECSPYVLASSEDLFDLQELGEKLCKEQSLSWCGHMKLIGFTIHPQEGSCGMIYEVPEMQTQQNLQEHKTLSSSIAASHSQDSSQPALEDRFRLGYNLALSVAGYFAQGDSHRYISSDNIVLIGKDMPLRHIGSAPLSRPDVRSPYLLQSCEDLIPRPRSDEDFLADIYRHPNHDINNQKAIVPSYDIYGLGLVLLEIGLWIPLSRLWKPKYDRTIFMERVQRIYSQKLASKCGSRYMRLVQRCLHAPAELLGKNKPEDSGVHLLEVIKDLRHCCAIDEEGLPPISDIERLEILLIEQMCKTERFAEATDSTTLPPMQVPGSFPEKQEFGVTSTAPVAIKRKPIMESTAKPEPIRKASKKKEPSAGLKKWPELQIAQDDLDQWNSLLMPKLQKLLQDILRDSTESCSVSLMKLGPTPETAKTTICIQCTNTVKVHEVLTKRFKPKKGWGVVILKGDIRRSGTKPKSRRKAKRSGGKITPALKPKEQKYQEKPSCGASIGAFKDNEHLPPVSFGGTILVDGELFGMTVHHMLDSPSDNEDYSSDEDEKPIRSAARQDSVSQFPRHMRCDDDLKFMNSDENLRHFSDLEISDDDDQVYSSDSEASTIRPDFAIIDDAGVEHWFIEDSDSAPELDDDDDGDDSSSSSIDDEDDDASIGDIVGIVPENFEAEELAVTQPAIDDVDDDFFPNMEDRDDDHLASHTFGHIHASSGIRRVMRGHIKHEVDWALIRVHKGRLDTDNPNILSSSFPAMGVNKPLPARPGQTSPQPTLTSITPANKLSNVPVACRARSSGQSTGRISQAMCLVKLHGRHTFSFSWCVDGITSSSTSHNMSSSRHQSRHTTSARSSPKKLGIPGDSGAWVYNPETGELCGHVLAYGEKLQQAYIAPMEVMFEDIKHRLGAQKVELPTPTPPTTFTSAPYNMLATSAAVQDNGNTISAAAATAAPTQANTSTAPVPAVSSQAGKEKRQLFGMFGSGRKNSSGAASGSGSGSGGWWNSSNNNNNNNNTNSNNNSNMNFSNENRRKGQGLENDLAGMSIHDGTGIHSPGGGGGGIATTAPRPVSTMSNRKGDPISPPATPITAPVQPKSKTSPQVGAGLPLAGVVLV